MEFTVRRGYGAPLDVPQKFSEFIVNLKEEEAQIIILIKMEDATTEKDSKTK